MEYREIGKTGKRSSIIGLGCENLDGKPFEQVQVSICLTCLCPETRYGKILPGRWEAAVIR